jgi:hypothetical protein
VDAQIPFFIFFFFGDLFLLFIIFGVEKKKKKIYTVAKAPFPSSCFKVYLDVKACGRFGGITKGFFPSFFDDGGAISLPFFFEKKKVFFHFFSSRT